MWTGWDYRGETELGTWTHGDESVPLTKPYPQITAGTGAIDLTGEPGVPTLLANAVWGRLGAPAIAVRPLDRAGQNVLRTAWRSSDGIRRWARRGAEGTQAEIEVYVSDEQVELVVNGRSLGRRQAGRRRGNITPYAIPYEPGEIVTVGCRNGIETGRSTLRSAAPAALLIEPESATLQADGQDLSFLGVELRDAAGTVEMLDDDDVRLEITGPAVAAASPFVPPANGMGPPKSSCTSGHSLLHSGRTHEP